MDPWAEAALIAGQAVGAAGFVAVLIVVYAVVIRWRR